MQGGSRPCPRLADRAWRGARPSAIGVALLGATVAWRLATSTYGADLRTICDAEPRSGHSLEEGMSTLAVWLRANLRTPEGNLLVSSLADTDVAARADRLRREAQSLGVSRCDLAGSYERLAEDARYRSDVQHLCSAVTFPGFAELDDEARLDRLEDWIDARAASPLTKRLGDPLRGADVADRAEVLWAAARRAGLLSCDNAKSLGAPR
jgi:hypothetical protein